MTSAPSRVTTRNEPMVWQHRRPRVHDRSLEIGGAPLSAHVGEIGAGPRPVAADAMAARAAALAFENRLAPSWIARRGRAPRLGRDRPEVRDDVAGVDFGDVVRRHPRIRDAGPDDADEILVGCGAPELTAAQVHARDAVTVRTVTRGAAREKEPPAVLHVRRGVFVLGRQRDRERTGKPECKSELAWYLPACEIRL